jgi:hypothetical protein
MLGPEVDAVTEAAWLESGDPQAMLSFLRGRVSDRKLRLFACACCRRIWHLLSQEASQRAVDAAEMYADGLLSEAERDAAREAAYTFVDPPVNDKLNPESGTAALAAFWAIDGVAHDAADAALDAVFFAADVCCPGRGALEAVSTEEPMQCHLLRCIIGNPFRPVALNSGWLTPRVVALAQAIYTDGGFDRMPELADALEHAGCDNADILSHCRGTGPHVRGCWAVDLVLGKE